MSLRIKKKTVKQSSRDRYDALKEDKERTAQWHWTGFQRAIEKESNTNQRKKKTNAMDNGRYP